MVCAVDAEPSEVRRILKILTQTSPRTWTPAQLISASDDEQEVREVIGLCRLLQLWEIAGVLP